MTPDEIEAAALKHYERVHVDDLVGKKLTDTQLDSSVILVSGFNYVKLTTIEFSDTSDFVPDELSIHDLESMGRLQSGVYEEYIQAVENERDDCQSGYDQRHLKNIVSRNGAALVREWLDERS